MQKNFAMMRCEGSRESDVLFSFGLITDIQYADICDRQNYQKTKWRRYRNALTCLRRAVSHWKDAKSSPAFIVQLGDIIDGFNANSIDANDSGRNLSKEALEAVMIEFSKLPDGVPVFHNMGNHELYNFSRQELERSVLHPSNNRHTAAFLNSDERASFVRLETKPFYFSFTPHPKFCFVYLDSYDISLLGVDESSCQYKEAREIIQRHNKNDDLDSPIGLYGLERRFVRFNGAISTEQLSWLEATLKTAEEHGQKAVVFSHVPIYPGFTDTMTLLWNYQDVLEVLWQFPCVVACFHGHTHQYSYAVDEKGIHHYIFDAIVEAPLDSNAFATLHVKDDSIDIEGFGIIEDQVLKFSH